MKIIYPKTKLVQYESAVKEWKEKEESFITPEVENSRENKGIACAFLFIFTLMMGAGGIFIVFENALIATILELMALGGVFYLFGEIMSDFDTKKYRKAREEQENWIEEISECHYGAPEKSEWVATLLEELELLQRLGFQEAKEIEMLDNKRLRLYFTNDNYQEELIVWTPDRFYYRFLEKDSINFSVLDQLLNIQK